VDGFINIFLLTYLYFGKYKLMLCMVSWLYEANDIKMVSDSVISNFLISIIYLTNIRKNIQLSKEYIYIWASPIRIYN